MEQKKPLSTKIHMDLFLALGILGMAAILFAFLMEQRHKWSGDDLIYDFTNFVGSFLLVVYGLSGRAWPFVILNGVFAIYSLWDLVMKDMEPMKMKKAVL